MRKTLILLTLAGATIAFAACSREQRAQTAADTQAAAGRVAEEARQAASSPEVKKVGAEIKQAAGDVGEVAKGTAQGAAQGAREAAAKVEAESQEKPGEAPKK